MVCLQLVPSSGYNYQIKYIFEFHSSQFPCLTYKICRTSCKLWTYLAQPIECFLPLCGKPLCEHCYSFMWTFQLLSPQTQECSGILVLISVLNIWRPFANTQNSFSAFFFFSVSLMLLAKTALALRYDQLHHLRAGSLSKCLVWYPGL